MSEENETESHGRRIRRNERGTLPPLYIGAFLLLAVILAVVFLLAPVYFLALTLILAGLLIIVIGRANPISLPLGFVVLIVGAVLALAAWSTGGVGLVIGGFHQSAGI